MENPDPVIVARLEFLQSKVRYLKSERAQARGFSAYAKNIRLKGAVERNLQVAVEACLDIGRRVIAIESLPHAENNQAVFHILHDARIIPAKLLPMLIDMTRFRNIIVHDYARIDDVIVYTILTKRLGVFDAFATAIRAHLRDT